MEHFGRTRDGMEELDKEMKKKTKYLIFVLEKITEHNKLLETQSSELRMTDRKLELKGNELQQMNIDLERRRGELIAEEELLARTQERRRVLEEEIERKGTELSAVLNRLADCGKQLDSQKKLLETRASELNSKVELFQDANVRDEKTLQVLLQGHLNKCSQLYRDVSSALKTSSDPAKLALDTIQELYSVHLRMVLSNRDSNGLRRSIICLLDCLMDISPKPKAELHGEAMKFAVKWKNKTLVNADNPIEVFFYMHFLAAFSLAYTFEADNVHNLFDATFLGKYAPSLCKSLGVSAIVPVTNERHPPEAPSDNEDILRDEDVLASFSPSVVSTNLPFLKDSGEFVLDCVKDALTGAQQRGEVGLAEPMVKILLPFLEEIARVLSSINSKLHLDAVQVAKRWWKMMRTRNQFSQLEALAFLHFIVAYRLVNLTIRKDILQFAMYVAHFKQAPKLVHALGLGVEEIQSLVHMLIDTRQYIPAVRFMVVFKLNYPPLHFLKEEISNLRRSAKGNGSFVSQDEDRAAVKLGEIIELIKDFNLEVDLPADLIVKLMVLRKSPSESQYILSSPVPINPPQILPPPVYMPASHTVVHNSYISNRGVSQRYPQRLGVSLNQQAVGSNAFRGQSSRQAGSKRLRVDFHCL